jgi:hypothetical protein
VIIPAIGPMDPALSQALSDLLHGGTGLVLESGAGFVSPTEFARNCCVIISTCGLKRLATCGGESLRTPPFWRIDPYEGNGWTGTNVPYVSYDWPREAKVREFSRVILCRCKAAT